MAMPVFFGEVPEHKTWWVKAKKDNWTYWGSVDNWWNGVQKKEDIIEFLHKEAERFGYDRKIPFDTLEIKE